MPTRPPFFTPARIKQAIQLLGVVILLIALTAALHYVQRRHTFVNTKGFFVFASDEGSPGHSHVFIEKFDGTVKKQLTSGAENDTQPVFAPDGSSIAFISDRSGSNQVYVMDADAQQINQITTGSDSKIDPAFSPDGTSVAYLSRGQLLVTDTVSLATQLVYPLSNQPSTNAAGESDPTTAQSKAPVTGFAWCPFKSKDGNNMAVIQEDEDSGDDIVTLVPADATVQPVYMLAGEKISIAWAPDGSKLAVAVMGVAQFSQTKHHFITEPVSGIALFDQNGTAVPQPMIAAAQTDGAGPQNPAISADSSQVGFDIMAQTKVGTTVNAGLALSPLQPGVQPKIVGQPGSHEILFSPDGTHVLFLATPPADPSKTDIIVVDMTTNSVKDLNNGVGTVSSAQWSLSSGKG